MATLAEKRLAMLRNSDRKGRSCTMAIKAAASVEKACFDPEYHA